MLTYDKSDPNHTLDTIKLTLSIDGSTPSPSKANVNGATDIVGAKTATASINVSLHLEYEDHTSTTDVSTLSSLERRLFLVVTFL